jgi:tRNA G46 methylase TrmB
MSLNEKYRFLDIGGGPDMYDDFETMSNLRAVQLAKQNPQKEYIVFDIEVPQQAAQQLSHDLSNLHFIQGKLDLSLKIPFEDNSIDEGEMNFMYTPLVYGHLFNNNKVIETPKLYEHVFSEASRVLRPGGTLTITEKEERLRHIEKILTDQGNMDRQMSLRDRLGLTLINKSEITSPAFSGYAQSALEQKKLLNDFRSISGANQARVYSLKFRKNL